MTIKQLNATYLIHEDRILLRFNTAEQAEYRLWLTRRVALFILAASSHLLAKQLEHQHSVAAVKAIQQFENEAVSDALKTSADSTQNYQSGTQFPLGFDPLLVLDVTCALMKNGEKISLQDSHDLADCDDALSIDFVLPGGANLNLKLTGNMLRATCALLDQLRHQAGWGDATLSIKKNDESESFSAERSSQKVSLH